jgi:dTDP-4-amino-4,6-dideoxygalactose transaminase
MRVPFLDLRAQYAPIREEVRQAIDRVLDSQRFILGPEGEALENEIAAYSHCAHGIGVSSGTDALLIALMAIDIRPGDEVITTPYSFFATAASIARLGAIPKFADIDPHTFNLDPAGIEVLITPKTRAILPVHLYGQTASMTAIMKIAQYHGLVVIEDAAQAIGAEQYGKRAGSFGDMACFSFYPSKNLGGAGEGGMITTNNPELAERLRILRNQGSKTKYHNELLGGNFRLDEIQAAVLRVKMKYLDEWTEARRKNASIYRDLLAAKAAVEPPYESPNCRHTYNQFVLRMANRDETMARLRERHIGCDVYYPIPRHLQRPFAFLGHEHGDFPQSEAAAAQSLALPIYPELTSEMISAVCDAL